MDIGASHHMTFSRDIFTSFKEWNGTMKLGDDAVLLIKGSEIVQIKIHDGIVRNFDSWFVPGLKKKLILLDTLPKNGLKYHGGGEWVRVFKGALVLMKGKLQHGFYFLQGTLVIEMATACVKGKQCRVKFSTDQLTSKEIMEYVHSDLWGPFSVKSQGGCVYFVTFIDDYSRKVWVYFLKIKDDVFRKFKEWKTMVEKQTRKKVKTLRTDNGLEFCNTQFDNFCKKEDIVRYHNIRHIPQQNEVAKQMNQTIMARARSPSTQIGLKMPQEVWSGKPSNYSDLRIFGCPTYAHANDGNSLDKFLISRDVTFDESAMFIQRREQLEPQVKLVGEEADNTGTRVEDSIAVKKGKEMLQGQLAKNMAVINELKALLKSEFEMKDLGAAKKILGTDKEVKYMKTVPYLSAVGSLMYVMVCTRPDLAHAVSVGHGDGLVGYADSDYGGDLVKRRSLTCFIFTLFRFAVSWKLTLQPTIGLSMTKAEYMSVIKESQQWSGSNFGLKVEKLALVCDSQSALSLAKNPMYHERTKHIDVRLNFIRDVLEEERKETTKRDIEEPLAVGEILSQGFRKVLVTCSEFFKNYQTMNDHHLLARDIVQIDTDEKVSITYEYVSILDNDAFPRHVSPITSPLSMKTLKILRTLGSSYGIICFHGYHKDYSTLYSEMVVFWNPSIRKSVSVLMDPSLQLRISWVGFGVCPKTRDPKLVMINDIMGFIYWLAHDDRLSPLENRCNSIISFNLSNEEFVKVLYLPYSLQRSESLKLFKWNECLILCDDHYYDNLFHWDVWMVKADGFTMMFRIDSIHQVFKVLGFMKNGEAIFIRGSKYFNEDSNGDPILKVYDPSSRRVNDYQIPWSRDNDIGKTTSTLLSISSYMETLLLHDH
uniref:Putative polyprotein n=1 Tax=Tanacetum cinerariifolium TaxID=118510 RepID=A0A6L2M2F2_TANCI|nr:putative polyprotein [Tanacetum cinerariifolium]